MPRDGAADPVARSLSKIFCERASFELKDDDIQAYRSHIRQQAASIVAKAQEDEEYLAWKVGFSLSTTSLPGSHLLLQCKCRMSMVIFIVSSPEICFDAVKCVKIS